MINNVTFNDITLQIEGVREGEYLTTKNATGKYYEQNLLEHIMRLNIEGSYLDIGSNFGNHSVFFTNYCKCTKLYAVEANKPIYDILMRNLIVNSKCPFECFNVGVYNKESTFEIDFINEDNLGSTSFKEALNGKIKCHTIDQLFLNKENIALIKIDVEGLEIEVLEGAIETIKKHKPVLVVEVQKQNSDKFFNMLPEYKSIGIYGGHSTHIMVLK